MQLFRLVTTTIAEPQLHNAGRFSSRSVYGCGYNTDVRCDTLTLTEILTITLTIDSALVPTLY